MTAGDLIEPFKHLGGPLDGRFVTFDVDGIVAGRDANTEGGTDSAAPEAGFVRRSILLECRQR